MADIERRTGRNVPEHRSSSFGSPLVQLQREMNRVFDNFLGGGSVGGGPLTGLAREGSALQFTPCVDISEDNEMVYVSAELPGMEKDDVDVTVRDNVLRIRGEKTQESTREDAGIHRTERSYGYFDRRIQLPSEVDIGHTEAKFDNGILSIHLPKTHPEDVSGTKLKIS